MPKNKFQDVVFTIIMAAIMVYGMVVYNIALNTGIVDGTTFIAALHELPIMVPVAFILEFFIVGRLARLLAFTVMSLVATILFKEPSFGMWVKTWAMNFPMAILYQMFYCGPFVRLIFRAIFERKDSRQKEAIEA